MLNNRAAIQSGSRSRFLSLKKILFALLFLAIGGFSVAYAETAEPIFERYAFKKLAGAFSQQGSVDGDGSRARFDHPAGADVDHAGNLYVADSYNQTIRKITPTGTVSTFAGLSRQSGSVDGIGENARFNSPFGIAVVDDGTVYVADYLNSTIRKITPNRVVTTLAGLAEHRGERDGTGSEARFIHPTELAVDSVGNVFVADSNNVRQITPEGVVTTLQGFWGQTLAVDKFDNLFSGYNGQYIYKRTPAGVVTKIAGIPWQGYRDGPIDQAIFSSLMGIDVDDAGDLYVLDFTTVRKISAAGEVTTLAGLHRSQEHAEGIGSNVRFYYPGGIAVADSGYVYVVDRADVIFRGGPASVSQLANISTRGLVQTGDNVLIGGFIARGWKAPADTGLLTHPTFGPKKVIIRAVGPSLAAAGIQDYLPDPILELRNSAGALIASNDNWKDTQQSEIEASGVTPTHDLEAAIVTTLESFRSYTAIVRGTNGVTGTSVIEVYDLNSTEGSVFVNISTRGFVGTDDNAMIGGFIVGPAEFGNAKVLVRAIGPSLTAFGVPQVLQDPTVELRDGNGGLVGANDDWRVPVANEITIPQNLQPNGDKESALMQSLPPGAYTAIVRGKNNTTGVGLVEVYNLD